MQSYTTDVTLLGGIVTRPWILLDAMALSPVDAPIAMLESAEYAGVKLGARNIALLLSSWSTSHVAVLLVTNGRISER